MALWCPPWARLILHPDGPCCNKGGSMQRKLVLVLLVFSALAVGALLTVSPSAQARLPQPGGVSAPVPLDLGALNYIRKLPPKPGSVKPVPANPNYRPLACLAPVVNVSQTSGNEDESFVVVNPNNPNNIVVFSNLASNSTFRAYSFNGGTSWTRGT